MQLVRNQVTENKLTMMDGSNNMLLRVDRERVLHTTLLHLANQIINARIIL